jgi:hypothetical protein
MGGRGERDLRVPRALRRLVRAELAGDAGEVLRPAQAVPHHRVVVAELAEPREHAAELGHRHPVRRGELAQGGPPDRALQMDVQMRLREAGQVTHAARI